MLILLVTEGKNDITESKEVKNDKLKLLFLKW